MKKLFVVLFIMGCTGFAAVQAQDAEKTTVAKRLTDSMTVQLSLTEDQVPKVLAINQDFSTKAAAIRSEGGGKMDKLKKVKAANSERDKALKAILTDEQFLEYKANKKENKALAKERMKARKQR
jgi:predicted ATP-grasp superfamily ATP-dependent carboligase